VLDAVGQGQPPQEVAQVVRRGEQLQADLVVHEVVAGQPRPLHRVLALLDPLLGRPATVVAGIVLVVWSSQFTFGLIAEQIIASPNSMLFPPWPSGSRKINPPPGT
jgi:hypothetical protein